MWKFIYFNKILMIINNYRFLHLRFSLFILNQCLKFFKWNWRDCSFWFFLFFINDINFKTGNIFFFNQLKGWNKFQLSLKWYQSLLFVILFYFISKTWFYFLNSYYFTIIIESFRVLCRASIKKIYTSLLIYFKTII